MRSHIDRVASLEGNFSSVRSDRTAALEDEDLMLPFVGMERCTRTWLNIKHPQGEVRSPIPVRDHFPHLHPLGGAGIAAGFDLGIVFDDHSASGYHPSGTETSEVPWISPFASSILFTMSDDSHKGRIFEHRGDLKRAQFWYEQAV